MFSIYLSKTSNSQPLIVTHGRMIDAVFQQNSASHSNCYKHSHLLTATATAVCFFAKKALTGATADEVSSGRCKVSHLSDFSHMAWVLTRKQLTLSKPMPYTAVMLS